MDYNNIATGIFGFFTVMGFLILIIFQNKSLFSFLSWNKELKALEKHFVFCEIQLWLDKLIEVKCGKVMDQRRGNIARKFLRIKFEAKKEYYHTLIKHLKENKEIFFEDLMSLKLDYNRHVEDCAKRENIPDIVVSRYQQFRSQADVASYYLHERIMKYDNFATDAEKLAAIFYVDLMEIYNSTADIESVIMSLNGEIDKALNAKET